MRGAFPPCSSFRGEMITKLGVNVGRKIYPIASPQCYPGDGGVRPNVKIRNSAGFEERGTKRKRGRKARRERERERIAQEVNLCRVLQLLWERVRDFLFRENDNFPDSNVHVRETTPRGWGIRRATRNVALAYGR